MQLPANLEARDVLVNGRRVHYAVTRGAPAGARPAVLVHGVGLSHRYLAPLAAAMGDRVPVYVPDLPGFGRSYKPRRVQTLDELADWLNQWIDALDLGPVHMVGQSLGCQVVVHLASRHPDSVHRLVLQGVTVDPEARTLTQQFVRWRRNQRLEQHAKKDSPSALPDYLRCGLRRIVRTYRFAVRDRPEHLITRIRCPALVIHGEKDPIASVEWARQVARLLPHGRLLVMDGVAHTINAEAPERLAEAIVDDLTGTSTGSR